MSPLLIYSRFDLNRLLLERAERAGAQIEKTRVLDIERQAAGWRLNTKSGSLEADFCVVATGARNPLREVGTQLTAPDTMSALGYYVPGEQERIDIQFLPRLQGYIWVFPALRTSFGGDLRQGRTGAGAACPAGAIHGGEGDFVEGRGFLQPRAAGARD